MDTATRRQARFAAGRAILTQHAAEDTWYDVCPGRRRNDDQPGMVLAKASGSRQRMKDRCMRRIVAWQKQNATQNLAYGWRASSE